MIQKSKVKLKKTFFLEKPLLKSISARCFNILDAKTGKTLFGKKDDK